MPPAYVIVYEVEGQRYNLRRHRTFGQGYVSREHWAKSEVVHATGFGRSDINVLSVQPASIYA